MAAKRTVEYLMPKVARLMREDAGMTKAQMAVRLQVTRGAITQYEDDRTETSEATVRKYAKVIGFPSFARAMMLAIKVVGDRGGWED